MTVQDVQRLLRRLRTDSVRKDCGYKTACYLWTGATSKGYDQIGIGGKRIYVSRMILAVLGKLDLNDHKQMACHRCDQPSCVRLSHLYRGTGVSNVQDCYNRGRMNKRHGETHPCSTIPDKTVREIRNAPGLHREIAQRYGVARQTVGRIKRGDLRRET